MDSFFSIEIIFGSQSETNIISKPYISFKEAISIAMDNPELILAAYNFRPQPIKRCRVYEHSVDSYGNTEMINIRFQDIRTT